MQQVVSRGLHGDMQADRGDQGRARTALNMRMQEEWARSVATLEYLSSDQCGRMCQTSG